MATPIAPGQRHLPFQGVQIANRGQPDRLPPAGKAGRAEKKCEDAFVALNATNNVYQAFGSFLNDALYQWA